MGKSSSRCFFPSIQFFGEKVNSVRGSLHVLLRNSAAKKKRGSQIYFGGTQLWTRPGNWVITHFNLIFLFFYKERCWVLHFDVKMICVCTALWKFSLFFPRSHEYYSTNNCKLMKVWSRGGTFWRSRTTTYYEEGFTYLPLWNTLWLKSKSHPGVLQIYCLSWKLLINFLHIVYSGLQP